jgi:hypothetical protein
MPSIRTTWTITHQRPLERGEDPLAALGHTDPDVLLWAIEDGQVTTTVDILEHSQPLPGIIRFPRTREAEVSFRTVLRSLVAAAMAVVLLVSVSEPAGAWAHPPTPDIQIFHAQNRVVRHYGINTNAACRWQYGSGAWAKTVGSSWRDWRCVAAGRDRSVDFTSYCRATYRHGRDGNQVSATHGSGVYTWRCRVDSPLWA